MVGRRFGVSLLSRVLADLGEPMRVQLGELHSLDFIFPGGEGPEPIYSFKHALTQDVVYAGLLERRRRQYHAAAGVGLEELYAGRSTRAYQYGCLQDGFPSLEASTDQRFLGFLSNWAPLDAVAALVQSAGDPTQATIVEILELVCTTVESQDFGHQEYLSFTGRIRLARQP